MNAYSALADLLQPRIKIGLLKEKRSLRLVPRTAADELPPYPEQLSMIDGIRRRDSMATFIAVDRGDDSVDASRSDLDACL